MSNKRMHSEVETTLTSIAKHINRLNEKHRNTRKRALEALRKEVVLRKPAFESDSLRKVFSRICSPLLKVLFDHVENCRLLSLGILSYCVNNAAKPADCLTYVIPTLVQRLRGPRSAIVNYNEDTQVLIESSEELRMELVMLLSDLIRLCRKQTAPYVDDIVTILQITVIDPFPEVKKASCKCVTSYAQTVPEQFHMMSESMIKPLLQCLGHQHSCVRVEVIHAIGSTIQHGNNKLVDEITYPLAKCLFDLVPSVRAAVTQVVGNWLLELIDRYYYFPLLIPLLLTSMEDEITDIREQAEGLWHDVGLKYEQENDELRDNIYFSTPDPEHYPTGIERPHLGCRALMYHHFSDIVSCINNDITDWVVGNRIMAAKILHSLLVNMEDNVTMNLQPVVHVLTKASSYDEAKMVQYVEKCSVLIGYFVPPEVWVKMVLKQVILSQSPGLLRILSYAILGSQRTPLTPFLPDICSLIGDPLICEVGDLTLQTQLCSCLAVLIHVAGPSCEGISLDLFAMILTQRALAWSEGVVEKSMSLLADLARVKGLSDTQELFGCHSQELVDRMQVSSGTWTQHSTERLLFDTLLTECGPVVGDMLDTIMPIFHANFQPTKDVEVRLELFNLLSQLLIHAPLTLNSRSTFDQRYVRAIVLDMILPNCVWHASQSTMELRTVAVSCLWALLHGAENPVDDTTTLLVTPDTLVELADPLLKQLQSALQDDNSRMRLIACRVLTRVFKQAGPRMSDLDALHQLYPELLKRLNDGSDDVRTAMCDTFIAYLCCFSSDYAVPLWRAHYEALYRGLLVHLDDPDCAVQEEVLQVLTCAAEICPPLLLKEIDLVKHKHRSTHYCDLLVQHVHSLAKP